MDPVRDPDRVAAVRATHLLDTAPEEPFEGLAAGAAALLDAPLAFVTLVDDERSFWKSAYGLDPGAARGLPVEESLCRVVVATGAPVLVTDVGSDRRAPRTGGLASLGIAAWAGHPIRGAGGHVLGALSVADTRPRAWTAHDAAVLAALAGAASSEVGLRSAVAAGEAGARRMARLARVTAELSEALTPDDVLAIALRETTAVLGGDGALIRLTGEGAPVLAARAGVDADAAGRAGSAAVLPLAGHGGTLGEVVVALPEGREVTPAERALAGTLAGQCAQALERARLFAAEQSARARTERLQRMTAALAATLDQEDVGRLIVSEGMSALGAIAGVVMLRDGDAVRVLAATGYPPDLLPAGQRLPLDAPLPLVDVVRTGEPFWFQSAADWPESFPARRGGLSSVAVGLPLTANGALTGAVAFRFLEDERVFGAEDRELAVALAAQCASALERARLHDAEQRAREAAERAEDRAQLLADVSLALDAPVGLAQRFDALAGAVVPRLADFCTVRVIDDRGRSPLVACRHADPAKNELVRAAYAGDLSLEIRGGPAEVIRSGRAVLISDVTEERWRELPRNEEFLERMRELAPVSYLGVPMTARGHAVGALALMSAESGRRFTEEDRDLAVEIGRRAGLALDNAILYEGQRQVAETLQEALLPSELPALDGGTLARRYVASAEPGRVGGDWYDAIPLPGGRVLLCVGDVVGRGPQAAAVMGQLRGALGIFASEEAEPGPLLDRLAGFAAGVPDAMGTTAALCLVDLGSREVRYACAGHPPPLVVPGDGGPASFLWEGRSPPLGLAATAPRPQAVRTLRPGDIALLYSDGLVERPRESIDDSLERLRAAAGAALAASADALCDTLLGTMAAEGSGDDTALLALRLDHPPPAPLEVTLPADAGRLAGLRRELSGWLDAAGAGPAVQEVVLAGSEAAANCVEHAYRRRSAGMIRVRARVRDGAVELEVADTGSWRASPAPGDRGRGLGMMRALMDDVAVRTDAGGTVVRMSRRLDRPSGAHPPAPAGGPPAREAPPGDGEAVLVRPSGAIDHASAPELLARLRDEVAPGAPLTIDLRDVPFLDSAGTRMLGELIERARPAGVHVVVRAGSVVHRAVDLAGLGAGRRIVLEARP